MKILFLGDANNIHTVRWVNELDNRGHEVFLISNSAHLNKFDKINKNVKVKYLKYLGDKGYYLNAYELRKLYSIINPDVVNAHYASGYGTLARIARLRPLILSVWGSDVYEFPYESNLKMKILIKNLRYADKIASTSCCMANQVVKILKEPIDIAITPFGVDCEKFKSNKIQRKNNLFVFGTVKTLGEIYGIEYIIRAFKLLLDKLENEVENTEKIILQIYGRGKQEQYLKQLCKELQIEDRIEFKGYIINEKVPEAINNMDVFCLGSISESFGVAAIEAMACEKPVIATDASGFLEVMIGDKTGFIVSKKSSQKIADKMYELFKNPKLRQKMGKEGRVRVLELYDWGKNVSSMERVYKETIQECK